MGKALDIKGTPLSKKDRVICIESSIIVAPMCTHPFKIPKVIPRKYRKNTGVTENDDLDTVRVKEFNASMSNCRMHRDMLLGKNTVEANNPGKDVKMRVLTIKDVSSDHIAFYNDKERPRHESLMHFHPAYKFLKIKSWKKTTK